MAYAHPRHVAVLAYPRLQALDATGPLEVFSVANRLAGGGAYRVELIGLTSEPQATSSGYALVPARAYTALRGPLDTLVIAGGVGSREAAANPDLIRWIRRMRPRTRRMASVCTGAFLLAAAGLLDGRRATTHWASCDEFARRFPQVDVDSDPIFIKQGDVYTSAGVLSGVDLSLALVEEDLGRDVALLTARHLVVYLKRPGGQSQFSVQLSAQAPDREVFRKVQAFIAEHPEADLSVAALAARSGMSPRNFARRFLEDIGETPARYVRKMRVEAARRALEETNDGIVQIAERVGFGTDEAMRRAFLAVLDVPPQHYRQRFGKRSA